MGAELAAFGGVEAAFEQGAEDGGVDLGPVEFGGREQGVDVGFFERQGGVVVEEAAVEPGHALEADAAAGAHGGEERGRIGGEVGGGGAGRFEHLLEELVREQVHVLGEHAEHEAVDEMRDGLGRVAIVAQALGEGGEFGGGVLGQRVAGFGRFEAAGVGEGGEQRVAVRGVAQVVERDGVGLLDGVGPVGADDDAVHVGHDQERRVLERDGVVEELTVGGVEVCVLSLLFPAEAALAPDVGPAFAAGGLGGAFFEGESVAFGVCGDGGVEADERAEVVEVRLRG